MILLIINLITVTSSIIQYDGTTVKFINEPAIFSNITSNYSTCKRVEIISSGNISLLYKSFTNFPNLEYICIQANSVKINEEAIGNCSSLQTFFINCSIFRASEYMIYPLIIPIELILNITNESFDFDINSLGIYNISKLSINASGDLLFEFEGYSINSVNIDQIILHANYINILYSSFRTNSFIDKIYMEAFNSIQIYENCFEGFKINDLTLKSGNQIMIREEGFRDGIITNSLNIESDMVILDRYALNLQAQSIIIKSKNDLILDGDRGTQFINGTMIRIESTNGSVTMAPLHLPNEKTNIFIKCKGDANILSDKYSACPYESLNIESGGNIFCGDFALAVPSIGKILLNSTGEIELRDSSFAASYVDNITLISKKSILLFSDSIQIDYINSIYMHSGIISIRSNSFQPNSNLTNCTIISKNCASFHSKSFYQVSIESMYIKSDHSIDFYDEAFRKSGNCSNFIMTAPKINFGKHMFLDNKNYSNITINAQNDLCIDAKSFVDSRIQMLNIFSNSSITFEKYSYYCSKINQINIISNGTILFEEYSFSNILGNSTISIRSESNITFGFNSFDHSQIKYLYASTSGSITNNQLLDDSSTIIIFENHSFYECPILELVDVNTKGSIYAKIESFKNNNELKTVHFHAGGKVSIDESAFNNCSKLSKPKIETNYDENNSRKKSHGSSHKNDDDEKQQKSAINLGDFEIQTIYLGTSPNIFFNLNVISHLMRPLRKLFGRIIPSPELVHSAIWVGSENAQNESLGAIFVYGKYINKYNMNTYLFEDGAKAYMITLQEFKERYPSIDNMKLKGKNTISLYEFIEKIKKSGEWTSKNYNWPTRNCQHFTAKLIDILQATRDSPNENDWIDLPKIILNSLRSNENNN